MGKMDKTEKYTVAGLCFGGSGVFLCEDAVVCARVYGYCDGTVVEFGVDSALIDAANPTAKAGSYSLAPTGSAGATLTLKAQGDAKNVKEDIAKGKTMATITWTFAAGNAAE